MRLIDADALGIGRCNPDVFPNTAYAAGWNGVINIIQSAPTIDAVPVVHGRWEVIEARGKTALYRCTACKTEMIDFAGREDYHSYCHNCGARMDQGEEDGK